MLKKTTFLIFLILLLGSFLSYSQEDHSIEITEKEPSQKVSSVNENMKIRELELEVEHLEETIDDNKENNNLLIDSANRSVDYVNGLVNFLTVLIGVATITGAYLAFAIRRKLSQVSQTNKEMQDKMTYLKLLDEARYLIHSGQRYEAEQRAVMMREIKPEAMHGYVYQGAYLKTIGSYKDAYNAMKTAGEKLGTPSRQIEFNLACYSSLDNDFDTAFKHLNNVLGMSKTYLRDSIDDPDLDNIRTDPRFTEITEKLT